jgi:hypothetical protein
MARLERSQFIAQEWQRSGGANPLGEFGTFQDAVGAAYGSNEKGHNELGNPVVLTCIDEGISPYDIEDDLGLKKVSLIRTAGSGILARDWQQDVFQGKKDGIRGVLSHGECGAAGIYAQEHLLQGDVDAIGDEAAMKVAQSLETKYLGRITPRRRPSGLHTARAIYYDGTSRGFEASKLTTLPQGFGISRGFGGREAGLDNAELAKTIAMGDNGFGEKFTQETPLYLVGISDGKEGSTPLAVLQGELEEIKDSPRVEVKLVNVKPFIS